MTILLYLTQRCSQTNPLQEDLSSQPPVLRKSITLVVKAAVWQAWQVPLWVDMRTSPLRTWNSKLSHRPCFLRRWHWKTWEKRWRPMCQSLKLITQTPLGTSGLKSTDCKRSSDFHSLIKPMPTWRRPRSKPYSSNVLRMCAKTSWREGWKVRLSPRKKGAILKDEDRCKMINKTTLLRKILRIA